MKVRHKPPTLVSMWMLDVFCCALGCVTLLFLLNSRMATDAVNANRAALVDLATADKKLAAALTSLDGMRVRLTDGDRERERLAANVTELSGIRLKLTADAKSLADQLAAARKEKDDAAKKLVRARAEAIDAREKLDASQVALVAAEKKADVTAKELAAALDRLAEASELLKKRQADLDTLSKKETASAEQVEDLLKLLRKKEADRLALETRVTVLKKDLSDAEVKLLATQKQLDASLADAKTAAKAAADEIAALKAGGAKGGEELAAAKAQIKDLSKKIDDANATIIDLQGDKAKLADKYDKFQKESESRFAGIAMTGKRVVFAVDMSGSMGKRDLNNLDSTKWPMAVETVCKVMRSIPTLEEFQVVVFSSSAEWLFGGGQWQGFRGEKSVEAVREALLNVKPKGDTNMYAAFEKAFALRPAGLDTIYLFSDGLPTSGEGLTASQRNANLSEQQLGEILGKHVRETLADKWNPAGGKARVKINSVGFYFESPDVGAFLWSLSRENEGSFVGMSKP